MLARATSLVHHLLKGLVSPGDVVLDATCGRGHDTVFLGRLVGEAGLVHAFDVQQDAIRATRDRWADDGLPDVLTLHHASHEEIDSRLDEDEAVACAVFNLGYLPGSDKQVVTQPFSTISAHEAILKRLGPNGSIVTTVYVGHEGGRQEEQALREWLEELDEKQWSASTHEWVHREGQPPFIVTIQRRF